MPITTAMMMAAGPLAWIPQASIVDAARTSKMFMASSESGSAIHIQTSGEMGDIS